MAKYRVAAEANSVPITTEVEAVSEEHAWVVACNKFSSVRLYNGKVEELPTRSELLARIQELETAGRHGLTREYFEGFKVANQRLELILATAKETGLIDAKSVRKIMLMDVALLNNPPLEKE